jgi:hypothetical protein
LCEAIFGSKLYDRLGGAPFALVRLILLTSVLRAARVLAGLFFLLLSALLLLLLSLLLTLVSLLTPLLSALLLIFKILGHG